MTLARCVAAAGMMLALAATPARACMSDTADAEAQGTLTVVAARDAAGRPQRPYILVLAAPACLTASDPEDSVKSTGRIHVFSSERKIHARLADLVGKRVRVRGRPFPAHTAHHHAPIVMEIAAVDPR
jgi:hypothetical protein